MTDKTEKAVQDILRRANGSGKTIEDLFDLSIAINEDSEDRHQETIEIVQALTDKFDVHCSEADERDERIEKLEATLSACPANIERAVISYHNTLHSKHLEEDHAEEEKQRWVMWGVFSHLAQWIPYAVIVALIAVLIDVLVR